MKLKNLAPHAIELNFDFIISVIGKYQSESTETFRLYNFCSGFTHYRYYITLLFTMVIDFVKYLIISPF